MLKHLIAFSFAFLSTAGAHASDDADREALQTAWRSYSELFEKGNYRASLVAARRVLELSVKVYPDTDKQVAAATYNYANNLI